MTNEHFKGLSLAQGHTAEMNAARENAERWCEAVGKLEAAKDAEIADLRKELATEHAARAKELEEWTLKFADERAAREQAVFLREHMQRERDTTLKENEILRKGIVSTRAEVDEVKDLWFFDREKRQAAETALASARTVISLFAPASAVARAWLTSHPAPEEPNV